MKEDDNVIGPLFPRLHVNDADKGGPRAPPRNKMALYEQLSVPSLRLNSSASSTRPFPHHNSSNSVPSLSSSQGCGHQRNMFSSFHATQVPIHSAEMINSRASEGMNHPMTRKEKEFERKSMKQGSSGNLFGTGSAAECSSHRPHKPNAKNSTGKNLDDVYDMDDIVVPSFNQSGPASSQKDSHMAGPGPPGKITVFGTKQILKSPVAVIHPNSNERFFEQTDIAGVKLRNSDRNHIGKDLKETSPIEQPKEIKEKSAFHKIAEQEDCSKGSLVRADTSNFCMTDKYGNGNIVLCQENGDLNGPQTLNGISISTDGKSWNIIDELHSNVSPGKNKRTMNLPRNCYEDNPKGSGFLVSGEVERKDDAEPSMVDTGLGFMISPDDIVERIGQKHFWNARTAIVNQQRIFAIQLFELHRLIKVQKMMAASPHLLLDGNTHLSKYSVKAPNKAIIPQLNTNTKPEEYKRHDDLERPKHNVEQPAEENAEIPALPAIPACDDSSQGGTRSQVPKVGSNSSIPSPMPMAPDEKSSPLCIPPMANQWLLPVMSPSEGLVYKPYSGPCPPTGGFMAPFYGSCTPLMNPAYGLPASHQPPKMAVLSGQPAVAPHYFATPYDLRTLNPVISSSAIEQVSNLPGSQANGQTGQHSQSSCNMFHPPRNEAFSGHLQRFPVSKNSEYQGSTASSPPERPLAHPDRRTPITTMRLAPAANSLDCPSQSRDSQTRVIKVVPHNARSASESAARIFRSIQQERQQYDS